MTNHSANTAGVTRWWRILYTRKGINGNLAREILADTAEQAKAKLVRLYPSINIVSAYEIDRAGNRFD